MAEMALIPRSEGDYAAMLRQMLPRGPAWDFDPQGDFAGLLASLADEMARLDARAFALIEETDPRTALETLVDWERVTGLPDACTGAPDNVGERRLAVLQKLTGLGGQRPADFVELAARLGFEIEIVEHRPFRMGARMGERIGGDPWAHAWTVRVLPPDGMFDFSETISVFQMGSRMGDRLRGFGALDLECVLRRDAPAQSQITFAYHIEPEPDFWIEFTN